jgi:hypothetical protein
MNGITLYLLLFMVLFVFLNYHYYKQKRRDLIEQRKKEELQLEDFFYHPDILSQSKRRKIWVYIPLEKNSRQWESFGSRTSTHLNLSVMNLCIKSIIDWCSQTYDIILFTDQDISEILKSKLDLSTFSGDVLEKQRELYILEILYEYGGILLPPTIYMRDNMKRQDVIDRWFVCDKFNTTHESNATNLPSAVITGAPAKDAQLRAYIDDLAKDHKEEYTANYFKTHSIFVLDGSLFGMKNILNEPITLDDLMSNKKLKLPDYNIGLYMPYRELLDRNLYKWFCKMSEKQILETHCAFSYYILDHS